MSSYEYIDEDGDKLTLEQGKRYVTVTARGLLDTKAIFVANADAPTVAAELLKAAGQEATILPKTTDIVRETPDGFVIGFGKSTTIPATLSPENMRIFAAHYIAVAEYIENKAQRETEAAKKLQERRDAVLQEMGYFHNWERAKSVLRKAIDRIIELEDGK